MDTSPPQKKGMGPLGWIGIGCGGIVLIAIIACVVVFAMYGSKFKQFGEDFQKNPTRTTATAMTNVGYDMVAEDDINKRYTLRQKQNGQLVTFYWSSKTQKPESVPGDFSAIPKDAGPSAESTPSPEQK
jgi:hypothetical protein